MALTITIRRATPGDLAAVDRLLARSYSRLLAADYPPSVMVLAVPLIARARPELLASGRYFLAVDATDRVMGAGGWSRAHSGLPGATPADFVVVATIDQPTSEASVDATVEVLAGTPGLRRL